MNGVLEVSTVHGIGVEEDGDRFVKRDTVFVRVGVCLPRIPLEHLLSIYGTGPIAELASAMTPRGHSTLCDVNEAAGAAADGHLGNP